MIGMPARVVRFGTAPRIRRLRLGLSLWLGGVPGRLWAVLPSRWTVVETFGAGLLGGGVWAQWGAPWACMLWGSLLLTVAVVHAALAAPKRGE